MGEDDILRCGSCGSEDLRPVVHYGSYTLRCRDCGESVVATSFIAVAPDLTEPLRAAVIDDAWNEVELIGIGTGAALEAAIAKAAHAGKSVLLAPIGG